MALAIRQLIPLLGTMQSGAAFNSNGIKKARKKQTFNTKSAQITNFIVILQAIKKQIDDFCRRIDCRVRR